MTEEEARRRRWALVLPYRDEMLRVARGRLPSSADADDCVQEALLRAAEYANLDERQVGGFLFSTLLRICADQHRAISRSRRALARLAVWDPPEASPEEAVCDRAEATWMSRHIDQLPQRQRDILAAKASGLSCGEVADQYAVSYKTVESALSRARTRLRGALAATTALGVVLLRRSRYAAPSVGVGIAAVATATLIQVPEDRQIVLPLPEPTGIVLRADPSRSGTATPGRSAPLPLRGAGVLRSPEPARLAPDAGRTTGPAGGDGRGPVATAGPTRAPIPWVFDCLNEGVETQSTIQCRYPSETPDS